jgi:hypothetical protein
MPLGESDDGWETVPSDPKIRPRSPFLAFVGIQHILPNNVLTKRTRFQEFGYEKWALAPIPELLFLSRPTRAEWYSSGLHDHDSG